MPFGAITSLTNTTGITLRKFAAGSYTAGVYTAGAATDTTISGSLQPINLQEAGDAVRALPAGREIANSRNFWTLSKVEVREKPDRLIIDGVEWEAVRAESWPAFGNVYYKVLVTRMTVA